jgi:GAF domain-containing protein
LVTTFADQAVIAIENARLLRELRERTEDLTESLQQQTATADVLKIISRSAFDLQKVFDALTESARHACGAYDAVLILRDSEFLMFAHIMVPCRLTVTRYRYRGIYPWAAPWWIASLSTFAICSEELEFPIGSVMARRMDVRTMLAVPLMREQEVIGSLGLRRAEVRPFTDKQIALAETFADQAVIAIENARLFEQVQATTRDLEESLQQQTATADVLKVISRSAFDLDSVMNTLTHSAAELCKAEIGALYPRR